MPEPHGAAGRAEPGRCSELTVVRPLETEGAADYAEAEARLVLLERRAAAQAAALARAPRNMPVPPHVLALLSTVPRELDGVEVPPWCQPRLVGLVGQIQDMVEDLALREHELAGRIATVRAARRAGPAPHLIDYSG